MGKDAKKKQLKAHDFANMLPLMSDMDFDSLKANIASNGLVDPIELYQGKILDGRHRYRACIELQIKPKFTNFKGMDDQAIAHVCSREHHRQMSESQRAAAAVNFLPHFEEIARERMMAPLRKGTSSPATNTDGEKGKSSDHAGAMFGVSGRYVSDAKAIKEADEKLFQQVFNGKLPITRAVHQIRRQQRASAVHNPPSPASIDLADCRLIAGDCIARLEELPAKSARVVFADPPYNFGKKYHADKSGDRRKDETFMAWCRSWLSECVRVLAPDGSIFIMMAGRYAGRLDGVMRELGLHYRNTIYWWENNPENQRGNFSDAVRPILYFTRSKDRFIFNDDCRVDSRRKQIGDKRAIDAGKLPDNVWIEGRIPGNSTDRAPFDDAPPQLPISIPETCIRVASEPGDTIIDPFNGNGTTAIAALVSGRKYIGIDQSKKYLAQSQAWIRAQLAKIKKAAASEGAK